MIPTVGSYWFLKGTNIEVGIKNVSGDGLYAVCTFRNGKREGNRLPDKLKKSRSIMLITQQVPIECLSPTSSFTKRHKLKSDFTPMLPLQIEKASPKVIEVGERLHVWGLKEMFYRIRTHDSDTDVITFAVRPLRKAHISVVRYICTLEDQSWVARPSHLKNTSPVECGYIPGTTIRVHVLIEHPTISLYKISNTFSMWIPNDELRTECLCEGKLAPEEMTRIGTVYLHGFIPVEAFESDESLFVNIDGVYRTVNKDVVKDKDPDMAFLSTHRQQEKLTYMSNHRKRREQTQKLLALAVF